jgi:hypothetical protein
MEQPLQPCCYPPISVTDFLKVKLSTKANFTTLWNSKSFHFTNKHTHTLSPSPWKSYIRKQRHHCTTSPSGKIRQWEKKLKSPKRNVSLLGVPNSYTWSSSIILCILARWEFAVARLKSYGLKTFRKRTAFGKLPKISFIDLYKHLQKYD